MSEVLYYTVVFLALARHVLKNCREDFPVLFLYSERGKFIRDFQDLVEILRDSVPLETITYVRQLLGVRHRHQLLGIHCLSCHLMPYLVAEPYAVAMSDIAHDVCVRRFQ